VRITDLTPRFLEFYRAARAEEAGPERRWALWRERYSFAAVPPTAQGMALAREQLEESWAGYESQMGRIRAGAAGVEPSPATVLARVADLLGLDRPLDVEVVIFVGMRAGGAFSLSLGEYWRVALPVEQDPPAREIAASHEFAHAVHARLAGMDGTWVRSVGQLVLGEGLAMHVARNLFPGRPVESYVGGGRAWLEQARASHREILDGLRANLDATSSEASQSFTLGPGPAGLGREGYYAGWVLVDHLLGSGWTLRELARVPRAFQQRLVERSLSVMLEATAVEKRGPEADRTPHRLAGAIPDRAPDTLAACAIQTRPDR
jgi:hypothetical protein